MQAFGLFFIGKKSKVVQDIDKRIKCFCYILTFLDDFNENLTFHIVV